MKKEKRIQLLKSIIAQKGNCININCRECRKAACEPKIFSERAIRATMQLGYCISYLILRDLQGGSKHGHKPIRVEIAKRVLSYLQGPLLIDDEEQIILNQNS